MQNENKRELWMYKHIFDPIAADEFEHSFLWYEKKSANAAEKFYEAVQEALNAICIAPERYRKINSDLRELRLKKYPFNLVYFFDADKKVVLVISIYHQKRDPNYKINKQGK
ncbi:MAG: type II toxin-antitoxin system RelE/ParE family toxin [Chitinophagaceae bacterium]|nr:type II toxin-antitoxin system RelE/ParE family toxin [Chitinophagaceae bacterium]